VFSGVFITEDIDEVGIGITMTADVKKMLMEAFWNISLRSACFTDEAFFW